MLGQTRFSFGKLVLGIHGFAERENWKLSRRVFALPPPTVCPRSLPWVAYRAVWDGIAQMVALPHHPYPGSMPIFPLYLCVAGHGVGAHTRTLENKNGEPRRLRQPKKQRKHSRSSATALLLCLL